MTGDPGISPTTSSPPLVCASASSSSSSSATLGGQLRPDPVEIAPGAAADVPVAQRLSGAVEVGHRGRVDHDRRPRTPGPSCNACPSSPNPVTSVAAVSPAASAASEAAAFSAVMRRDRLREDLPGRLVPVVQHAETERFGQGDRQAGRARRRCAAGGPGRPGR